MNTAEIPRTTLTPDAQTLLDYYRRDADGRGGENPFGGLPLERVRVIRQTLERRGLLERTPNGRWRVTANA